MDRGVVAHGGFNSQHVVDQRLTVDEFIHNS